MIGALTPGALMVGHCEHFRIKFDSRIHQILVPHLNIFISLCFFVQNSVIFSFILLIYDLYINSLCSQLVWLHYPSKPFITIFHFLPLLIGRTHTPSGWYVRLYPDSGGFTPSEIRSHWPRPKIGL